ncbi:MAG TPA: ester cyclase [Nannocystaceae bacterium]|nr:ester cyclase [Nannocystaceae bacterium]
MKSSIIASVVTDTMTIAARNKANYLAAKQAFNDNDMAACMAFYAEAHQIKSSPNPAGRAAIQAFLTGVHAMWPGIQLVVEHVVAEHEWVMGRSRARAIHSATVFGVAATQKPIETTFWDLHRFDDDGLIVETWNLMDGLAILAQLGRLPSV